MPRVSVIIPAWQAEAFVGRAIASAAAQTLADIEIIVVNDCSTDGTAQVVARAAAGDPRVVLINHVANGGPSVARNTALEAAKGDWVAILDADDCMDRARLGALVDAAEKAGADIVADDLLVVNEVLPGAAHAPHLGLKSEQVISLAGFARNNGMFNGARHTGYLKPLFRRAFLAQHGLRYDPAVRIGEDYMFVAAALALGARYVLVPRALYRYHVRGGSISRRLNPGDVDLLLAADDRFQARFASALDAPTRAAIAARRASLEDARAFVNAVDALKRRQFGQALSAVLRRPASVRHFGMPIGARLARLGWRRGGS